MTEYELVVAPAVLVVLHTLFYVIEIVVVVILSANNERENNYQCPYYCPYWAYSDDSDSMNRPHSIEVPNRVHYYPLNQRNQVHSPNCCRYHSIYVVEVVVYIPRDDAASDSEMNCSLNVSRILSFHDANVWIAWVREEVSFEWICDWNCGYCDDEGRDALDVRDVDPVQNVVQYEVSHPVMDDCGSYDSCDWNGDWI